MTSIRSSSLYFALLAMFFAGIILSSENQAMAQTCGASLNDLVAQCVQYVQKSGPKTPPSKGCCAVVRIVDVPCICRYVNPQIESMVSLDKVVYVARSCGKAVRPGTKCGSYTVPPS